MERDPEAAKEKLKELEKDRAYERATLKHLSTGKWSVQLKKYAANNPGMQKLIGERLKLGRDLKSRVKHGLASAINGDSDNSDQEEVAKPLTKAEMLEVSLIVE